MTLNLETGWPPTLATYAGIMKALQGRDLTQLIAELRSRLPHSWVTTYHSEVTRPTQLLETTLDGNTYLFDLASSVALPHLKGKEIPDDRVVAVWGTSQLAGAKRDAARMRGFPTREKMDRGHLVSHAQGGGLDINLFPQRFDVNRGWSPPGREFRELERYCADHPGTFFFARPLYGDDSWIPHGLEYGVLKSASELVVKRFPN